MEGLDRVSALGAQGFTRESSRPADRPANFLTALRFCVSPLHRATAESDTTPAPRAASFRRALRRCVSPRHRTTAGVGIRLQCAAVPRRARI